ncbi:MAG TPA: LysE family transporter [Bryobacteraceae bacterium]|nr:LysE family transporter [Bryobacteraceae bacterium]
MSDVEILLRGIAAGLIISAPVGPVNVLCISRTLTKGRRAGAIAGVGAAAADTIYGAIAGFSVHFVIGFLIREEFWLRLFGGALLIGIGAHYYFRTPRALKDMQNETSPRSDYMSAFLLNLTNPTTVLSFLAVLTALGLHQHKSWWQGLTLVGGIFVGAMAWWLLLAGVSNHFRSRFNDRATVWMNRVAGVAMGGFGLVTLALNHVRHNGV